LLDSVPAHAFAVEFDAVSVMDETVQDGVGIGRIADDFVPAVDWKLGGDHRGAAAVSFFEDFQEIMPGGGIEGLEAPVIEDEQIGAAQIAQKAGMASVAMRQGEVLEEPGHALVEDRPVVATGLIAKRRRQPTSADSGQANDILPKNTFSMLSLNIRIIRLLEGGSWSFGALSTRGWSISLWMARTDAEHCCPPG
jgi:hypothetical protein